MRNRDAQIKAMLDGEKELAKITLQLLPMIKRHFDFYDGKKMLLSTGDKSAGFKKIVNDFYDAVKQKIGDPSLRIWIDAGIYSVAVCFEINRPMYDGRSGRQYFKQYIYFGKSDSQNFIYDLAAGDYMASAKAMIGTTVAKIKAARKEIAALKIALDAAQSSVPYAFRDLIND